jgi:diaminohydroxyphosphoribosylaminopyrimidine deaminase/5-amino-6-(5-phosphoribosylamino)uracil reductase
MISSKTLNIDNPKLNCRLSGFEKFSPRRIVLDKHLEIKLNSYIFKSSKNNNTIIFHNSFDSKKIQILKKKGITLIKSKLDSKKLFNLKIVLEKLYTLGARNLLVEGGDKITKNLIKNRLIDKFYLFKSPKKILTSTKHQLFTSFGILNNKYKKKFKISSKLVKDNISIYKR